MIELMVQSEDIRRQFSERLREALGAAGIPVRGAGVKLSKVTGKTPKAANKWLNGESIPATENLEAIAGFLNVRNEWLMFGSGHMHANYVRELQPVYLTGSHKEYPVISFVEAGAWQDVVDIHQPGCADEWQSTTKDAGKYGFWLRVKGDSMTSASGKSFPEGMLILVNPELECLPGHLVIAKLTDTQEATFKLLSEDAGIKFLKPLNPSYPLIPINGNCSLIGRVIEAKWTDL